MINISIKIQKEKWKHCDIQTHTKGKRQHYNFSFPRRIMHSGTTTRDYIIKYTTH